MYLHNVVDVLNGAETLRPQLKARGHLELGEARLQVELDAVAGPSLPSAKSVRRLSRDSHSIQDMYKDRIGQEEG